MYPSSSSSSSHSSMGPTNNNGGSSGGGLHRYGSAPGSLLNAAVDSVIGCNPEHSGMVGPARHFSSEASSESTCYGGSRTDRRDVKAGGSGLHRSYGMNEIAFPEFSTNGSGCGGGGGINLNKTVGSGSPLVRHSSSPAGFLNRLATASTADNGFSVISGIGGYNSKGDANNVHGLSRLSSQLSFTRHDPLSQITEEGEDVDGISQDGQRKSAHSYATANFGIGSWDDTHGITFSGPPCKRTKSLGSDIVNGLNITESRFGLSQSALEIATMEGLLDIPQDSVPCKVRAKRGCATHPRSIAERERRTRISGKLKKLQDLVPNMDKQTSYADMLELAVEHIKGLQTRVQNLNKDLEHCSCGCKRNL